VAGTLDVHDYVRFAVEALRLRSRNAYEEAHQRFMREWIQPALHPQALALVQDHQQQGDTVAIVTATNELVVRPIAAAFGVPELIAVELERDAGGWITGEIAGVPSMREARSCASPSGWKAAAWTGWTSKPPSIPTR
jgi:HAD superfamily phosphoserine phosphatase-like hydrolase